MRRREFIGMIGAVLSQPRPGYTQTKADLPVVGVLLVGKPEDTKDRITALRKGLQEVGFVEGKNYSLAMRFGEGDFNRMPQLVRDLAALNPRVLVTLGFTSATAQRSFPELATVFASVAADPIALGLVQSYAHPGGMITGNVLNAVGGEETMTQKRIGLFKQLVPSLRRLGMIASHVGAVVMKEKGALEKAASELSFELVHYDLKTIEDLEAAFAAGLRDDVSALYISGEPMLFANRSRVMDLVTASGKPSVGTYPEWGRAGLMMTYAADPQDSVRHAGIYVAKILNGVKPGDLPIEQASKFSLVINQKTAKALDIVVPPTLLALADEVIE